MMVIDNKFEIGQTVFINTDSDQSKRVITAISILPGSLLLYDVCCGALVSKHYEFELSDNENIETKING